MSFHDPWFRIHIIINTTPKELRAIADYMEKIYPKLKTGDSMVVHNWNGDHWTVILKMDQQQMELTGKV